MNRAKIFIAFTFLLTFAVCVSAQDIQFSNELSGFEFYRHLQSKGFDLSKSRSADLKRIFSEDCLSICDYNSDWKISFTYRESQTITKDGIEKKFILSPDYANTVWTIEFYPKNNISFLNVKFPDEFKSSIWSSSSIDTAITQYTDYKGLTYAICNNATKDKKYKKGDLFYIEYTVPKEIEKKALILIQESNSPIKNQ